MIALAKMPANTASWNTRMYGSFQQIEGAFWVHYPKGTVAWPGLVHAYVGEGGSRVTVAWSGRTEVGNLKSFCQDLAQELTGARPSFGTLKIEPAQVAGFEPSSVEKGEPIRVQWEPTVDHPRVIAWFDQMADPNINPNIGVEFRIRDLAKVFDPLTSLVRSTTRRQIEQYSQSFDDALFHIRADVEEGLSRRRRGRI